MDALQYLSWFALAKTAVYGTCAAVAAAHYLRHARGVRLPGQFRYLILGICLAAAGEFSGYAWPLFFPPVPALAVAGMAVLTIGTAVSIIAVLALSVAYRRTAARLRNDALTDPLTGLCNRRAFFEALEERLEQARRSASGERFAVAVLDLDHMKQINDTYGHLAGDEALRLVADALRRSIRDSDLACRYGGDEFAVLFPRRGPSAATLGQRLATHLERASSDRLSLPLSFSLGVAYYPEDGQTTDSLLSAADDRMYQHKRSKACLAPDD